MFRRYNMVTSGVPESLQIIAETLDELDTAFCLFDEGDRTLLWNRSFLRFFPEHDGHVRAGEPYAENLRRFYRHRLGEDEWAGIEERVAGGIARHRTQARPFVFQHGGRWLRVASTAVPGVGRYRIWTQVVDPVTRDPRGPGTTEVAGETALESVAEGIAILDADGRIEAVNTRFLSLYGLFRREGATGRDLSEVLTGAWAGVAVGEASREALCAALARLRDDQDFTGVPFEVPLPGGRWLRVTEQRGSSGAIFSLHADVTDLKRQQAAVDAAREAADRANRSKSAFLAMMSHEIRTPMNGILGMASLLLEGPLDAPQRAHAEALHRSAGALLVILNDILDVSKLEAAKLRLEAIPFDLDALVAEMVRLLRPTALAKGLDLSCRVEPGSRGWFLGDPTRLRQVLLNLVSNAVKFTASGRVSLAVRPGPAGTTRIEVTDTGIGIEPGAAGRLFETFEQADPSITRRYGGTGLGLSIARQLVELMGGRIGAAPRPEGGSLFWCELPLPRAAAPAEAGTPPPTVLPRLRGRVLVVEDNATNQLIARAVLERAGLSVQVAGDGGEAIAMARAAPPDLVLMDIQLPDMDGFEAARRIRQEILPRRGLPIVALTANAMEGARETCLANGLDDYLSKPFTPAQLLAKTARWMGAMSGAGGPA